MSAQRQPLAPDSWSGAWERLYRDLYRRAITSGKTPSDAAQWASREADKLVVPAFPKQQLKRWPDP